MNDFTAAPLCEFQGQVYTHGICRAFHLPSYGKARELLKQARFCMASTLRPVSAIYMLFQCAVRVSPSLAAGRSHSFLLCKQNTRQPRLDRTF